MHLYIEMNEEKKTLVALISLLSLVLQSPHAAGPARRIYLMQTLQGLCSPSSANTISPWPSSEQKVHQRAD